MSLQRPITDRILELLRGSLECDFEALVARAPEFTSTELDLEVARLSRAGQVIITRDVGIFTIRQATAIRYVLEMKKPEPFHSAWRDYNDGHSIGVSVTGGRLDFLRFSTS